MNKMEMIDAMATKTGLTKTMAEQALNVMMDTIVAQVRKGNEVKLIGFGTFTKTKRKARIGRNPQTGAAMKIPATWAPKFRAGTAFKEVVR